MKQKYAIGLALLLAPVLFVAFHGGKKTRSPVDFRDSLRDRRMCSRSMAAPVDSDFYAASSPMSQGVFSCLSCHDGTIAPVDSSYAGNAGYAGPEHEADSASHPVGMDYMQVMHSRPGDYNDPRTNPGIHLSDNKVTCLSCHGKEVSRNFGAPGSQTSLCLTCHKV